jgi:hypothetical protein
VTEQTGTLDSMVDNTMGCLERARSGCMLIGINILFLFFIGLFLYFANRDYRLDQVGLITIGTVTGLDESDSAEGGCCVYSPIVEFRVDGQTFTFTSGHASEPPRYQIGDQVDVQYDPGNPKLAEIEGGPGWLLWAGLIILFIVILLGMNVWGGLRIWRGEAIDN